MNKNSYNSFLTDGFYRFQRMIPLPLLERLRELFNYLTSPESVTERVVLEKNGKKYVTNLDHICPKGNLAVLELLGYPPILEIAEEICGIDFFLIQEFAVIKNLGDEQPVYWHQDMAHQRKGQCFTMGIYLDDAGENDGALRIVPGSHLSKKDICEISRQPSFEVPMQAGDILIHDMMLAHSSGPLRKNALRRVIYFEFLSASHVKKENIYTDALVQRRSRLHFTASRYYQSLHPREKQFSFSVPPPCADDSLKDCNEILQEIYSLPIHARPSTYCFDNVIAFPAS